MEQWIIQNQKGYINFGSTLTDKFQYAARFESKDLAQKHIEKFGLKDFKITPITSGDIRFGNIEVFIASYSTSIRWSYRLNGIASHCLAESEDVAILLALGEKYLGINNQFAHFAVKMLGINSLWGK